MCERIQLGILIMQPGESINARCHTGGAVQFFCGPPPIGDGATYEYISSSPTNIALRMYPGSLYTYFSKGPADMDVTCNLPGSRRLMAQPPQDRLIQPVTQSRSVGCFI